MRRRREFIEQEDDGLVLLHGHLMPAACVEANAQAHLRGFDDLPEWLRDKINYAPTPELGAYPTPYLISGDGPYGLIYSRIKSSSVKYAIEILRDQA